MIPTVEHAPGLYVAADGRVECHAHAPYRGSDTFETGDYQRVDARYEREWELYANAGPVRCEVCGRTTAELT